MPADDGRRLRRLRDGFDLWHRAQRCRTDWMDGAQLRRRFNREHGAGRTWAEIGYLHGYSESYAWMVGMGMRERARRGPGPRPGR